MRPLDTTRALSSQRMGGFPIHPPATPTYVEGEARPNPLAQKIETARNLWYALYGERKGERVDWWLHAQQHHGRNR